MRFWIAVRKMLFVLSWIPMLAVKLVLMLLGLVVVPLALTTRYLTASPVYDENHWPGIFWLWGNDEEGCPQWWRERKHPWYIRPWYRFWWYAIRNPANNLRFCFQDPEEFHAETNWSMDSMEAAQMQKASQSMAYYWRWHKWKSCYRRVWLNGNLNYSEIWFGWKIGSPVPGCGFTSQVRLRRRIGT